MANELLFLAYIFVSLVLVVFSFRLFRSWLNPLSLYSLVFVVVVIANALLPVYHPGVLTWLVLFLALFVFAVGSIFGAWWAKERQSSMFSLAKEERRYLFFGTVTLVLVVVYLMLLAWVNRDLWGIVFGEHKGVFYRAYSLYVSSQLRNVGYAEGVMLLAAMYWGILGGLRGRVYKRTLLLFVLIGLFSFLTGLRTVMFVALGIYVLAHFLGMKRRLSSPLKTKAQTKDRVAFVLLLSLVVVFLLTISFHRFPYSKRDLGLSQYSSLTELVLLEAGGHLARFKYAFEHGERFNYGRGAFTFGPVARVLCRLFQPKELCLERYPYTQAPIEGRIPFVWNGGTHLMDLYVDFGYLGVVLGSLLLGFWVSYAWQRALEVPFFLEMAAIGMVFILHSFRFSLTFASNFCFLVVLWLALRAMVWLLDMVGTKLLSKTL